MRGFTITETDQEKIRKAVAGVEEKTSGEIGTALIRESSSYAFPELLFSLTAGLLVFVVMLFCYGPIEGWISKLFWKAEGWYIPAFYGLVTFLVIGLCYWLTNIPGVDRLIVPQKVLQKTVHRRALVHFLESGIYNTRDRTGILLFISLREKKLEIIADEGINSKVEPEVWDKILQDLSAHFRSGEVVPGLIQLIETCGEILIRHFPKKEDDTNELPDALVFLEE